MADTDPPHEIDNVPRPHHRMPVTPNADARRNLVAQHETQHSQREKTRHEKHPPPNRRFVFAQRRDAVGNPAEAAVIRNQRNTLQFRRRLREISWFSSCGHSALKLFMILSPFPLTPALSPREREKQCAIFPDSYASRFADRLPAIPPLPDGEGRGEGEWCCNTPTLQCLNTPRLICAPLSQRHGWRLRLRVLLRPTWL